MATLSDALQTSLHTTERAFTRGRYQVEDFQASAVDWVRRSPGIAIGAAFAAGVLAALVTVQGVRTLRARTMLEEW